MLQTKSKSREYNSYRGWKKLGEKEYYFKSRWEYKYACFLHMVKKNGKIFDWLYEPQIFYFLEIKRGTRSYTPDFKVIFLDGSHCWVEVKGYMDAKSKTKLKRFKKYFPEEKISVVDSTYFKKNKLT